MKTGCILPNHICQILTWSALISSHYTCGWPTAAKGSKGWGSWSQRKWAGNIQTVLILS